MKISVATIVLTSFIALAVFGFVAMLSDMGENHGDCLASLALNGCPVPVAPIAMANFHAAAYKIFSSAVVTFLIIVLSVMAMWVSVFKWKETVSSVRILRLLASAPVNYFRTKRFHDWYVLSLKRDPASTI